MKHFSPSCNSVPCDLLYSTSGFYTYNLMVIEAELSTCTKGPVIISTVLWGKSYYNVFTSYIWSLFSYALHIHGLNYPHLLEIMLTNLMFPLGSLIELLPPHHQGLKKCLWVKPMLIFFLHLSSMDTHTPRYCKVQL